MRYTCLPLRISVTQVAVQVRKLSFVISLMIMTWKDFEKMEQ